MDDRSFEIAIEKMLRGDKEGLKDIYEAYTACIYSTILAIVRNKETAEDLTSEFFIKLWTIAGQYKFGGRHKAWLLTIARNMAMDALRKYKNQQTEPEIPKEMAAPHNTEEDVMARLSFGEALKLLDEKEEAILTLKFMGECTFREIAEILDMPMGTVTWKYTRGIEKLRRSAYGR